MILQGESAFRNREIKALTRREENFLKIMLDILISMCYHEATNKEAASVLEHRSGKPKQKPMTI